MAEFTFTNNIHYQPASTTEPDVLLYRQKNGLCATCGTQILRVKKSPLLGRRTFEALTVPGQAEAGRCLHCHPSPASNASLPYPASSLPPEQMAIVELQNSPADQNAAAQPPPQPSAPSASLHLLSPAGAATAPTPIRNQRTKRFCDKGVWGDYTGELDSSGQRHGRGVIKWEGGDEYDGEWKNNMREGWGTYRYASGNVYEGEMKNGNMEGRGTYRYASGDVYEGEWKNNKKEGRGTFRWADGSVYEGEYKNDNMEGRGTYRYADGRVEVTRYSGGGPVGEGVHWSADRQTAYRLKDGKKGRSISLLQAKGISDRIGVPVPT